MYIECASAGQVHGHKHPFTKTIVSHQSVIYHQRLVAVELGSTQSLRPVPTLFSLEGQLFLHLAHCRDGCCAIRAYLPANQTRPTHPYTTGHMFLQHYRSLFYSLDIQAGTAYDHRHWQVTRALLEGHGHAVLLLQTRYDWRVGVERHHIGQRYFKRKWYRQQFLQHNRQT